MYAPRPDLTENGFSLTVPPSRSRDDRHGVRRRPRRLWIARWRLTRDPRGREHPRTDGRRRRDIRQYGGIRRNDRRGRSPRRRDEREGAPGRVTIFEWTGSEWGRQAELSAGNETESWFGASIALDGGTALVGAQKDVGPDGVQTGSAYVFERIDGEWRESSRLVPDDTEEFDGIGTSVAIDGDTALVGAPGAGETTRWGPSGAAYVYRRNGGEWQEGTRLVPADNYPVGGFGFSLALSGTRVLAGAPEARPVANDGEKLSAAEAEESDSIANPAGAAYVFRRASDGWTQQATVVPNEPVSGSYFGRSVALEGERAIVGAHLADVTGKVYVFEHEGNTWSEASKLDERETSSFGWSVATNGSTLVVGAPGESSSTSENTETIAVEDVAETAPAKRNERGAAYVFQEVDGEWQRIARRRSFDDGRPEFSIGRSVSLDGPTTLVSIGSAARVENLG